MAYEVHGHGHVSRVAASPIDAWAVVARNPAKDHEIFPASGSGVRPMGIALNKATVGRDVTVHLAGNIVKAKAAVTATYGDNVGALAATSSLGVVSASGAYRVGMAESSALAGEVFSVLVDPERLTGA